MPVQSDTVLDRVARVKHTIDRQPDPRGIQVAVDGPCPNPACDGLVSTTVRSETGEFRCAACGTSFQV